MYRLNRPFLSFRVPLFQNECSFKDLSYENEFDLRENDPVGATQFDLKGFARGLVSTQR